MRPLSRRILSAGWAALLAFLILAFGQVAWGILLVTNLKLSPAVPWSVVAMALVLWLMWLYLGGKGWPHKTSEARRRYLRANRVSGQAFGWALAAGALSIVALTGIWIVAFRLFKMA